MLILEVKRGKILDLFNEKYNWLASFYINPGESDNSRDLKVTYTRGPGFLGSAGDSEDWTVEVPNNTWQDCVVTDADFDASVQYRMKIEHRSKSYACLLLELPTCVNLLRREVVLRDGIEKYRLAARTAELI